MAKELALQLKPQITGTTLKLRLPKKLHAAPTLTDGWSVVIGTLGKDRPTVEVWLDRFTGHGARKFYVGFYSHEVKQVKALSKSVSEDFGPIRQITDEDLKDTKGYFLAKRLPEGEFNEPIEEHYSKQDYHFFGFYDPTQANSIKLSAQFLERAVGFIVDVLRAQPKAKDFDRQTETYARCEDRKLVKAHLRRERSGFLAAECKRLSKYKCQICDFQFTKLYGEKLGGAFAEAHHVIPLKKLGDKVKTRPEDLITVCANCHRMLHRMDGNQQDIAKLKAIVCKNCR